MRFALALLPLLILPAITAAASATTESTDPKVLARQDIEKDIHDLPYLGELDLSQVLQIEVINGRLYPTTSLPVMPTSWARLKNHGGWLKLQVTQRLVGSPSVRLTQRKFVQQFQYRDLSDPAVVETDTEIDSGPESLNLSRSSELPGDGIETVQLEQSSAAGPRSLNFYYQFIPGDAHGSRSRHVSAASLIDLYLQDPDDVNAHLRPILRMLQQEQSVFQPESRIAYQVLADICPIDPATAAAADAAVGGLNADSFADRQSAMSKLRELGEPAAIHFMEKPPTNLTAEQAMRIDLFVAPYRPLDTQEARQLESDPDFLLDCQFSSDAVIRQTAAQQFTRVTGKTIQLSGGDLAGELAALRPTPAN